MSARPWRAVAFLPMGRSRITVARTSRAREESVQRWAEEQRGYGYAVDVWQLRPIPEVVAQLTQVADSSPGYGDQP